MKHTWINTVVIVLVGIFVSNPGSVRAEYGTGPYYATPSWDQKLEATTRFVVLQDWNLYAVLDKETGLVWEKDAGANSFKMMWGEAYSHCINLNVANRKGWHLPTIEQLLSLVDTSLYVYTREELRAHPELNRKLPAGHPFIHVLTDTYWSLTTQPGNSGDNTFALTVNFVSGKAQVNKKVNKSSHVWCVRGGQTHDAY